MRKAVLFGFVLVCVTALSFLSVTPLERKVLNPDGTVTLAAPAKPAQVEVVNFPAVQAVSGTVNVGNLPATQTVNGTVEVANLPLTTDGSLKVASPVVHYVGITQATFSYSFAVLPWSRACASEFPGTRVCDANELIRSIPPPPEWAAGAVLATRVVVGISGVQLIDNICLNNSGVQDCNNLPPMLPVACCGF